MDSKQYWSYVDSTRDKMRMENDILKRQRQESKDKSTPCASDHNTEHYCWIISLDMPMRGVNPGTLHQAQWRNAAAYVAQSTHRLATGQEIADELTRLERNKQTAVREEIQRKKKNYTVVVSPEQAGLGGYQQGVAMDLPINAPSRPVVEHTPNEKAKSNTPSHPLTVK